MSLNDALGVLSVLAAPPSGGSEKVAFYGMISALGVALIYGVFNFAQSYFGSKTAGSSGAAVRRAGKEHEAWERWLLRNGFDPRRIKTGYESVEEVRHASS